MKDLNSRYGSSKILTYQQKDPKTDDITNISYYARRFVPAVNNLEVDKQVLVTEGQRLDLIAHDTIGSPERFWAVADINSVLNPFSLTQPDRIGTRLNIPTLLSLLYSKQDAQ
jgi:hypothetical protein